MVFYLLLPGYSREINKLAGLIAQETFRSALVKGKINDEKDITNKRLHKKYNFIGVVCLLE